MDNESDELMNIESRQRKEKKELQAQIQAMKKTAKNDKTKKKELVAEILKLETEMDDRHKQEIENIHEKHQSVPDTPPLSTHIEEEPTKQKISKAQKRRDKKSQQEKERQEQIKSQEHENLHGPRNTEHIAITSKLKEKGLKIFPIPSDGDCLYNAIAHQLSIVNQQEVSINDLRRKAADYIRNNKDDFLPFMSNPDSLDMLTEEEFEDYCDKIDKTKVWGGQLEIRALSNLLKCPITVIQATGPDSIEQGSEYKEPALTITYHRHMYSLGEHYNSTMQNSIE